MSSAPRGRLLAVLGVAFGLAAIVGNTIGAGILRTPGDTAKLLPSVPLFLGVWLLGALYAFGGANAVVELATMTPDSGGQYNYARRALGTFAGFFVGWVDWIGCAGSATAVSLVFAETVVALVPSLAGREVPVAAALIIVITAVIWRGVKENDRVQQATSLAKAVAFLALIAAAVVYATSHGVAPQQAGALPEGTAFVAAIVIAMQGVIYAYDGWNGVFYFTEEVTDPGTAVPRATFGGLVSVTAIYLAVLVSFLLVLPLGAFAGDPLAGSVVARAMFGDAGDTIVRIVILVAMPSSVVALLPMSARVAFAMGRGGLAPRWTTKVNKGGTPTTALLSSAIVALLLLLTGTAMAVIAVCAFFFVAIYTVSFSALFVLRVREPDAPRPWRAIGHPWTTGAMLLGSVAFLVGAVMSDRRNGLIAAGVLVASYPTWRILTKLQVLRPEGPK